MMGYFHRQVQLWGEEIQESLQKKRVVIVGCGGLGSSLAIGLGSTGIGSVHLVDFDEVSLHNIHRQIAFRVGDEGKFKSKIVGELLEQRCPFVKTKVHVENFEEFTKRGIEVDLIIDATDNLMVREKIDLYAKNSNTPWIYGAVESFNAQVCFFDKSSFEVFKIKKKPPVGIAAPMVMFTASFQANLALRYLAGLSVKKDFLYYLYMDNDGELIVKKLRVAKGSKN